MIPLLGLVRGSPDLKMADIYQRIGVFRFIERKRDRACDLTGHRHSSAVGESRRIQEVLVHGDETALRLPQIGSGITGTVEWQLQNFNSRSLLQPSGAQHVTTEDYGLPFERVRSGFDLKKRNLGC